MDISKSCKYYKSYYNVSQMPPHTYAHTYTYIYTDIYPYSSQSQRTRNGLVIRSLSKTSMIKHHKKDIINEQHMRRYVNEGNHHIDQ